MTRHIPNSLILQSRRGVAAILVWLAACIVVTTALSLAAAHAPPRIRLLGLFSIAFGLLIGWTLVRLAAPFDAHPSVRLVMTAAAVLSFIGLIGSTWETARLEEIRRVKSTDEELAERLIEQFDRQTNNDDQKVSRRSAARGFRRYLSRRIRQLGDWPSPWPECFWFAELIAAAAAGGWMSNRSLTVKSRSLVEETDAVT